MSFCLTQCALRRVLVVIVLVLLTGCGVPDVPTGQNQPTAAAPTVVATPEPTFDAAYYVTHPEVWPTHSPELQTQVALINGVATSVANVAATNRAIPPAPQDGPRPVYPTSPPPTSGIFPCQSVDPEEQFAEWSCWQDVTADRYLVVSAGGESGSVRKIGDRSEYREDNTTIRGGLGVCVFPRDNSAKTCDPTYWRPEKEGRLKIIAAEGMRLTLESVVGNRYVFNVETRQWEAAPAIPVPTATPLPTDGPPPTFTLLPGTPVAATDTPAPTEPPTAVATETSLPTATPTATTAPTETPLPTAAPTSPPAAAPAADVITRHAPTINGTGRIDGSVQQLLGEALTLNGNARISGDLRVPGSPQVVQNGASSIGATATGDGSVQPDGYRLTLNGNAQLGRLVTRTDAVALSDVAAPASPTGTRDVTINQAEQPLGDPATLRHLTLNGNAGTASLPPGSYGRMTLNGSSALVLGVAGDTQPASYTFPALTLNGTSQIRVVGPVQITLAAGGALPRRRGHPNRARRKNMRGRHCDAEQQRGAAWYTTCGLTAWQR